jgi:hypothetical protein
VNLAPIPHSRIVHAIAPFGQVLAGFDTRLDTPPSIKPHHQIPA